MKTLEELQRICAEVDLLDELENAVSGVEELQRICTEVDTHIKGLFPNSVTESFASGDIALNGQIRFALEPRNEWPNGIWHNSTHILIFVCPVKGKEGIYYTEVGAKYSMPILRKKTGNVDQIINHLKQYFTLFSQPKLL